ncbi:MAG: formate dehydrogenase accessory sulfurtransferase FdhD [Nocardioides sp.]|nr:formate dehydrogenase accessory sulfurtransferase FdhD [Nocardioides sp.]
MSSRPEGPVGPVVRRRVERHSADGVSSREDRIATEEPLEIRVAVAGGPPVRAWTTMRTPGDDFDLAAGWVVNEGVAPPGAIRRVDHCTDPGPRTAGRDNVVTVSLSEASRLPQQLPGITAGSSACGVCGRDSLEAALGSSAVPRHDGPGLPPEVIRGLPDTLRAWQPVFAQTGGVHAAALLDPAGGIIAAREDVGRHNAVDKVVGALVLSGQSPAAAALLVSGRAGFELVQKAVACGAAQLVSVGAPTSLAVDLAGAAGLGLWGFANRARVVRYA